MTNREEPALTSVFLRIEHDNAHPQSVTDALGITPTGSSERWQALLGEGAGRYPWSAWVLASAWAVHSKRPRAHFQWLLSFISPRARQLEALREQGYRMQVYCIWLSKGGYGGPELEPDILRGLADLGIPVYFDVSFLGESSSASKDCGRELEA
jgi:hypothetical protein